MNPTQTNKQSTKETGKLLAAVSSLLQQTRLQQQTIARLNEQLRQMQNRVSLLEQITRR
jgi:DNA-binding IclR family transcriptional regulator